MLTHDQIKEQDEVKSEMTDDVSAVEEEQESMESKELQETEEQEEITADVAPVPEANNEEPTPEAEPEPEAEPIPFVEEEIVPEPVQAEETAEVIEPAVAEAEIPEPEAETVEVTEPVVEPVAEEKPKPKAKTPKPKAVVPEAEHSEMMQLLEESDSNLKKGQIVDGLVVGVNDKEVMVDIGYKSEGVISISEFAYSGIPARNAKIKVHISEMEDGEGKLRLSKKRADFILNIQIIKETFEQETTVKGFIRRRVKGGMIVDVLGIEAFLPGSQMSLKPIPNLDQFIGKEMVFKVVSLDEERRNIILSRKKVLEEEMSSKRHELLSHIEIGVELEGEVKNITQYGAFIDLGGIDGLLHLSDMSWGKINHPSEMLNIGDKLKVKVIHYDMENGKISLGLKQLVPHPWEHIEIKYPEGTRVTGKVVSVKSYGAFVEIEPGVEGLVHISEMSWTKKITDARRVLKNNDTVNAIVLELDKENKRISLGMKQMEANPWLTIEDRYPIGTVLQRKVKSLTTFGAFVEIEEGIDGLIHISDISWTKRIYHPKEIFRKNQDVEAIVLSIDRALHRIALGIKQLKSDPWETLPTTLPVNSEVKGKVSKLIPKGLLVDVMLGEDVVEGFVPISHLAIPKLEHSEDAFYIGEELPLKVIELDTDNRRLIMSVKAFFFSRDAKLQDEYIVLHEQYIRDRISRMQKKKAEKDAKQRERGTNEAANNVVGAHEHEHDDEAENETDYIPEMEAHVEKHHEEPHVSEPTEQVQTPVVEPEVEDAPVLVHEAKPEPETEEASEPQEETLPIIEHAVEHVEEAAPVKKAAPKKTKTAEPKAEKEKKPVKEKKAPVEKKPAKEKKAPAEKKPAKAKKTTTE
jgi:small subunit ribosomal protein S1